MAIFDKSNQLDESRKTTIISSGFSLKGDITTDCILHIDGNFEGTLNSSSFVSVEPNGIIKGDIIASKLTVSGLVEGSINADRVELLNNGSIKGKIISKELIIEATGTFEGESIVKKEENALIKQKEVEVKVLEQNNIA